MVIGFRGLAQSFVKWTPRVIAITIGGYYGLGIAYEIGFMALIDKIAIDVIKHFSGYAGVGFSMPHIQWHAAWVVRFGMGLIAGIIYDLSERNALSLIQRLRSFAPTLRWNSTYREEIPRVVGDKRFP